MKKILLPLLLLFSTSLFASTNASYLFLATAPSAKLIKEKGDNYSLELQKGPSQVGYFTDRPVRESGLMDMSQFLKLWDSKKIKNNFTKMPPNAAIAMILSNGKKQSFVAVLGKPEVKHGKVTYHLTKTSKNKIQVGKAKHVILFIDDIKWNPGGF